MRAEDIDVLLQKRPFMPFRIYLSDGQTADVKHPEMVFLSRSYMGLATPVKEGSRLVEQVDHFAYIHMVRLEILDRMATQAM